MNFRPKPGQSDEDLFKQNEEFLRQIKRKSETGEKSQPYDGDDTKRQKPDECGDDNIYTDPDTILSHAKAPDLLLNDILEKPRDERKAVAPPITGKQAFPQVFRRDKMLPSDGKKQSIFARMQQKKSTVAAKLETSEVPTEISSTTQASIKKILGPSDAQKIHEENAEKLSQMTTDEILAEKEKLMGMLNPNTLAFLKSKQQAKKSTSRGEPMEVVEQTSQRREEKIEVQNVTMEKASKNVPFNLKPDFKPPSVLAPLQEEPLAELPIPPEEAQRWLHMDVVETEKLRWMTKLPAPKLQAPGTPYPARFHFNGSLLPPESDLPVTEALHHHGSEPERAGYTLEELLLFSRSSVLQQRALGLTSIANILRMAKEGRLDVCLEESILPQLISAGVFSALRFSLDESVAMVIQAAALALAALLASQPDEVCLTLLLGTSYSVTQPCMPCPLETEDKEKGEQPLMEGELKDHELLVLDVAKGALRTDIVPRIRYLLEVVKPDPRTALALLEVLTRLSRHSREVAVAISHCPNLLAVICANFLPCDWVSSSSRPADMASVYGVPLAKALRLLRVMSAQSKGVASDLVYKYHIMTPLLAYLSSEPSETGVPDGATLLMEAAYTWQTLLNYGLAVDHLGTFTPVLAKLVSYHVTQTNLRSPGSFYQEHAVALLSLTQTIVILDAGNSSSTPRELLVHLGPAVINSTGRWLMQAAESDPLSFSDCKLVGASLYLVVTMFRHMLRLPEVDTIGWLSLLENLINSALISLLQSQTFNELAAKLRSHSSLLDPEATSGRRRDPRGLPSLGTVTWGQPVTLSLQPTSPLPLLQPLAYFVFAVCKLHPRFTSKVVHLLLDNASIQNYLKTISEVGCPGSDHWFSRWEVEFSTSLLCLSAFIPTPDPRTLHQAAFNLLPCIRSERKDLAKDVLETWIFSQRGFSDDETLTCGLLGSIELGDNVRHSAVLSSQPPSTLALITSAYNNLPGLHTCYLRCLALTEQVHGKMISQSYPAEGEALVPRDWPFLPLVMISNQQQQQTQPPKEEGTSKDERMESAFMTETVIQSLQWVLLLETVRPETANFMLSPTARFCRLACVFLAGCDIFLEPQIHALVESILQKILHSCAGNLDFTDKIPGLNAFWDLYLPLVQQYVGESYGDQVFAQFILTPLQQKHELAYRRLVWGEQAAAIRYLSLPIDQLLVGVEGFLEPMETDPMLLTCYLRALRSGSVRPTWSPLLHKVACHHVSQYVSRGEDSVLRNKLINGLKFAPPELQSLLPTSQ